APAPLAPGGARVGPSRPADAPDPAPPRLRPEDPERQAAPELARELRRRIDGPPDEIQLDGVHVGRPGPVGLPLPAPAIRIEAVVHDNIERDNRFNSENIINIPADALGGVIPVHEHEADLSPLVVEAVDHRAE